MSTRSTRGTHPFLKQLAAWGIPLWLLILFAMPAAANYLTSATATVNCGSKTYYIQVCGYDLTPNQTYTVDYTINFTPTGSSTPTTLASSSFYFTPTAATQCSGNFQGSFAAPLSGNGTLSGTATLTSSGSTVPITFQNSNGQVYTNGQINCGGGPPPPQCPPCPSQSIQSNFNGTAIPAGDAIWFNVHISASGVSAGTTIYFTCATVTSSAFNVSLPNGEIQFVSGSGCPTTSFNGTTWVTTVPINSNSDEVFLTGLALPLPSGLAGGLNPVTISGIFSANVPNVSLSWQWGAAAYKCFGTPASTSTSPYFSTSFYNALNVKPTHQDACLNNGDHAGTPENASYQCAVGGARGGGAANLTGSWSGTGSIPEVCVP